MTSEAQEAVTEKIKMRKRVKKSLIYAILMILGPIASIFTCLPRPRKC